VRKAQKCAISNLQQNTYFLDNAVPIKTEEFIERRDRLAVALFDAGVDAFALEPGYTFQYYGNISQTDWEPWEPEERPFLMIVQPITDPKSKEIKAKTTFLSPHFEEGRVRMLGIPFPENEELEIAVWEEHWNPYDTLLHTTFKDTSGIRIMVDEEMRDYIVRGLDAAGFKTVGLSSEVDSVRQRKSPAEVEILRAVNTGTVEAVRQMRPCEPSPS
jgi:Xaa-Pro aminopeptidase